MLCEDARSHFDNNMQRPWISIYHVIHAATGAIPSNSAHLFAVLEADGEVHGSSWPECGRRVLGLHGVSGV